MNHIIITGDTKAQTSLSSILENLDALYISTPEDQRTTLLLLAEQQVDLIICDLSDGTPDSRENLFTITKRYPYIPCLAVLDKEEQQVTEVMRKGVSTCLCTPINPEDLCRHTRELLEESTSGTVKGIPIHSLLQMLEGEEKTCTLRIRHKNETGYIFIKKGAVIGAETSDKADDEALYAIITWQDSIVEIKHFNSQRKKNITKPLISLIMEAFRLKDERDSLEKTQVSDNKKQQDLKHLSTAGNRISMDIGAKIKMEFDEAENPLVSTMVGMIPESCLIVTTPQPVTAVQAALEKNSRIVVKYVHMGRLCMFKTQPLQVIEKPHRLLFMEYPRVIHYHELRRAKRTTIFIPCTLHLAEGPEFYGVLIDLSSLGCLCHIKSRGNGELPSLDIDTQVQLRCLLPGLKDDQEINGIVKNYKKTVTETHIGIEFVGLQTYLKDVIEKYLYSVENVMTPDIS